MQFLTIKALKMAYEKQALYQYDILEHGRSSGTGNINVGQKNDEMAKTLLVMATLIASFTFTSAFTMPGGYDKDGKPVLIAEKGFKAFVITVTIAMTTSMTAAVLVFGHFFYRNIKDLSMKFITAAIVLVPVGLVSMLLAFTTGLFIVLSNNLTLAIPVCLIGFGFPILIVIFINCFDTLFYLHSSSPSLMTGMDFIEIVDSFEKLKTPAPTTFIVFELYIRLVFQFLIWMFIRLTLLVDPDERNYLFSSSRFWIKVVSERYRYGSFFFCSTGEIFLSFDRVSEWFKQAVSRFYIKRISM